MQTKTRIYNEVIDINKENVKSFWETRANSKDLNAVLLGNQKNSDAADLRNAKELALLTSFIDIKKPFSVLDIGCGMGRWANNLKDKVSNYNGFDFTDGFISKNKKLFENYPNCQFFTMPITDINKDVLDRTYDLIIVTGVLMYVNEADIQNVLKTIASFNAKNIYLQESVSLLNERLTLKDFYSEELNTDYSAIYRTVPEYENLINNNLKAYEIKHTGLLLDETTGAREETNAQYWFLKERQN